jgi:hypothetical protein
VGVVVALAAVPGAWARADHRSRTTADEPQYLLSALSLAEDHDLDIRDELRAGRFRPFHEADLPQQTRLLDDGRRVSPHDPLLPLLLAAPVAAGGWLGAKLFLALLAGVLAAVTTWVAAVRFGVRPGVAAAVVVAFGVVPPLAAYGTQVYPELPAALMVVVVVGALTARPLTRRHVVVATAGLLVLPWLSVKYAPIVLALGGLLVLGLGRERRFGWLAGVGVAGLVGAVGYAAAHQVLYTGWTPYAAGDHFVGGELTVVGSAPDHVGRTVRLAGLLLDARFGLAAWAPAFLLAVPALVALIVPLGVGWANATWVALTMSGWWWPGRQVVVVLPLAVVAVAWWADRLVRAGMGRRGWVALAVATAVGVVSWWWLLAEVLCGDRQLIIDFYATAAPTYRWWSALLPDTQAPGPATPAVLAGWLVVLVLLGWLGWRTAGDPEGRTVATGSREP